MLEPQTRIRPLAAQIQAAETPRPPVEVRRRATIAAPAGRTSPAARTISGSTRIGQRHNPARPPGDRRHQPRKLAIAQIRPDHGISLP